MHLPGRSKGARGARRRDARGPASHQEPRNYTQNSHIGTNIVYSKVPRDYDKFANTKRSRFLVAGSRCPHAAAAVMRVTNTVRLGTIVSLDRCVQDHAIEDVASIGQEEFTGASTCRKLGQCRHREAYELNQSNQSLIRVVTAPVLLVLLAIAPAADRSGDGKSTGAP